MELNKAIKGERRGSWLRVGLLLAFLTGVAIAAWATGLTDGVTPDSLRTWIVAAGGWGVLLYIGAFAAGNLLQLPGMAFIAAGILVYGPIEGSGIAALASMIAISTSFLVVRLVGGSPLGTLKNRWVRRMLDGLADRPVRSIAAMRLFMVTSPPLNYVLAMSDVRYRDYIAGSAAGLILPIVGIAIAVQAGIEVF